MSRVPQSVEREVRARANGVCEYCHMPESAHGLPHEVDHIIARKHEGETVSENLALACVLCNSFKGPNIASLDPLDKSFTLLFNPRADRWNDHFRWTSDGLIEGVSPAGRATVRLLVMNALHRVAARRALIVSGRLPPAGDAIATV